MSRFSRAWWSCGVLMWSACTAQEPALVASNCDEPAGCTQQALHLDSVDVLLVVDDSASIAPRVAQLKEQLPRMMQALTTGSDGETNFPPAKSVHVAVTTTDMGAGAEYPPSCTALGRDGVFVRPGEVGVTCPVSYPGYLSYEGGAAPLSVVESAACVPLVFSDAEGFAGCGFEQPLEAALKALWPADDTRVQFSSGGGHGADANRGFLRDSSLLVVVIVTDEDDCSATDTSIFDVRAQELGSVNLRCLNHADKLHGVQRYVDHLKRVRPNNDNVIFGVVAGVSEELVSDDYRAEYELGTRSGAERYVDALLAHPTMQEQAVDASEPTGHVAASCVTLLNGETASATPPRRLLQVARGFGASAVVGSICSSEFGATMGRLIRAVGDKLSQHAD